MVDVSLGATTFKSQDLNLKAEVIAKLIDLLRSEWPPKCPIDAKRVQATRADLATSARKEWSKLQAYPFFSFSVF